MNNSIVATEEYRPEIKIAEPCVMKWFYKFCKIISSLPDGVHRKQAIEEIKRVGEELSKRDYTGLNPPQSMCVIWDVLLTCGWSYDKDSLAMTKAITVDEHKKRKTLRLTYMFDL